jgi:hypothetical protein
LIADAVQLVIELCLIAAAAFAGGWWAERHPDDNDFDGFA